VLQKPVQVYGYGSEDQEQIVPAKREDAQMLLNSSQRDAASGTQHLEPIQETDHSEECDQDDMFNQTFSVTYSQTLSAYFPNLIDRSTG